MFSHDFCNSRVIIIYTICPTQSGPDSLSRADEGVFCFQADRDTAETRHSGQRPVHLGQPGQAAAFQRLNTHPEQTQFIKATLFHNEMSSGCTPGHRFVLTAHTLLNLQLKDHRTVHLLWVDLHLKPGLFCLPQH